MQTAETLTEVLTQTGLPASNRSYADGCGRSASMPWGTNCGRYLLIEELSRGSTGVVLRGYDPRLQREVALQLVVTDELTAQAEAQILREVQALAALSHPNIVAVYDVAVAGKQLTVAMELVRGTTLAAWSSAARPWRQVVERFVAAGRGLAAAHAVGLVHRNFSPTKVLVGADGRVCVTGFGLALVHQGSGCAAGPASDQHAFCAALWESLTGEAAGGSAMTAAGAASSGDRPSVLHWPRHARAPSRIRDALRRGLAPAPAQRWPSMEALLECLVEAARPRRRNRVTAAGVVALMALPGAAWAVSHQRGAERCSGALAQLDGVWDPERRELVGHAVRITGVAYAPDAWRRVEPLLDRYATTWADGHRSACEATAVRGEQPGAVLDLRMACLHRAKVELRAVTDLLARADAQVVEQLVPLTASLPDLARCEDVDALRAEVPPPTAALADAVERLRVELAAVKALREAGKYPEVLTQVQPLAERAARVPYPPLQNEVMAELAVALERSDRYAEANVVYRRVLRSAFSSREWGIASWAAMRLVFTMGFIESRHAEALAYAETAKALFPFADADTKAGLHTHVGAVFEKLGRDRDAEIEHRHAVAIAEAAWGAGHLEVSTYRGNLGGNLARQGRLEEAERELQAKFDLRHAALGPEHPAVANARSDLAVHHLHQGRHAQSESEQRVAVAAFEQSLGAGHLHTAIARDRLASALVAQGRDDEAERELLAVLEVYRTVLGPDHPYATAVRRRLDAIAAGPVQP